MKYQTVTTILKALHRRPDHCVICSPQSQLGAGAFARNVPGTHSYKPVAPGDTAGTAKNAVYFLLADLAIDMGLAIDTRSLHEEVYGRE